MAEVDQGIDEWQCIGRKVAGTVTGVGIHDHEKALLFQKRAISRAFLFSPSGNWSATDAAFRWRSFLARSEYSVNHVHPVGYLHTHKCPVTPPDIGITPLYHETDIFHGSPRLAESP